MNHLTSLIDELCVDGVEFREIGAVVRLNFGTRITKAVDAGTLFPVYGGGGESFRTDDWNREDEYVVSRFAMSERCVRKVSGRFWLLDSGFTFDPIDSTIDKDYIGHVLLHMQPTIYATSSESAQKNLKTAEFKKLRIAIPPIPVQREIVRVLEKFADFEAELEAELRARTRQFDHYLNVLTRPSGHGNQARTWTSARLGDVCRVEKGKTPIQKAVPGAYPLVTTSAERQSSSDFQFDGESVCIPLISSKGHGVASISRVYFQAGRFALGSILAAAIPNNPGELSAEFLYRYFQAWKDILLVPLMRGGANVSLTVDSLKSVPIAYPPIEEQRRISDSLRRLDGLISDESGGLLAELAARRRQHRYYRDKLLTFQEVVA